MTNTIESRLEDRSFMKTLVQDAGDAMFEEIVKAFPEIKTGDFSLQDTMALNEAIENAINAWVLGNVPK